jgi:hypothetical protein
MLNSSPFDSPAFTGSLRDNSLTRGRCIGSALFNPFLLKVVHRQSPSHGLKTPVDRLTRCHPLTLIVSRRSLTTITSGRRSLLTGCVYLHAYLVFKEPTATRQWRLTRHPLAPTAQVVPGRPCRLSAAARLGEPCEVTTALYPCQPLK